MARYDDKSWERHKPAIGDRVFVSWRDCAGTVIGIPWGTCVDVKLDNGNDCGLCGNDWAESIDDGTIQVLSSRKAVPNEPARSD